jgi:hypothetical protein
MPSEEPQEPQPDKTTTIKLPVSLKDELDTLKQDDQETYAQTISRLIRMRAAPESNDGAVTISLLRPTYRMILMFLPDNMRDLLIKGVR